MKKDEKSALARKFKSAWPAALIERRQSLPSSVSVEVASICGTELIESNLTLKKVNAKKTLQADPSLM